MLIWFAFLFTASTSGKVMLHSLCSKRVSNLTVKEKISEKISSVILEFIVYIHTDTQRTNFTHTHTHTRTHAHHSLMGLVFNLMLNFLVKANPDGNIFLKVL